MCIKRQTVPKMRTVSTPYTAPSPKKHQECVLYEQGIPENGVFSVGTLYHTRICTEPSGMVWRGIEPSLYFCENPNVSRHTLQNKTLEKKTAQAITTPFHGVIIHVCARRKRKKSARVVCQQNGAGPSPPAAPPESPPLP